MTAAKRKRVRLWTDDEIGFLLDNPRMDAREIGEILGRSRESVYGKRVMLKKGHAPSREAWTESDDDFIIATPGLTAAEVARHLGRTKGAVEKRRQILAVSTGVDFTGGNKSPNRVGKRRLLAKTCLDCGLLLGAEWFGISGSGWRPQCTRCRPRYSNQKPWERSDSKASQERLQAISLPHAVNHKNPWTDADHEVLADPDLLVIEKAIRLGRTYYATHSACSDNGYASKVGRGDPEKGRWVIDNPNEPQGEAA